MRPDMQMPTLPRATDEMIERVLDAAIPELRAALKTVMQEHHPVDAFDIAKGTNSRTGAKTRYVCFIAHEFAAAILEGTMNGMAASIKSQVEMYKQFGEKA